MHTSEPFFNSGGSKAGGSLGKFSMIPGGQSTSGYLERFRDHHRPQEIRKRPVVARLTNDILQY